MKNVSVFFRKFTVALIEKIPIDFCFVITRDSLENPINPTLNSAKTG